MIMSPHFVTAFLALCQLTAALNINEEDEDLKSFYADGLTDSIKVELEPQPLKIIQPRFLLFTNSSRGSYCDGKGSLYRPTLISDRRVLKNLKGKFVVIVHGFEASLCDDEVIHGTKSVLQELFPKNPHLKVIFVDWRNGARQWLSQFPYAQAVANARLVAAVIANYLQDGRSAACIGDNIGAHICGLVGQRQEERRPGSKWARIVGYNIDGFGFDDKEPNERLSPDDAVQVLIN